MFWTSDPGASESKRKKEKKSGDSRGTSSNKDSKNKKEGKPPILEKGRPGVFLLFFGVFLPLAAIFVESTCHICARSFFDPLPSPAHVLLFSLIPLSNWLAWLGARRDLSQWCGFLTLGSGMAMGIGILYSLMFLPLVPLSVIGILFVGIGLLGLAPMLSLPCIWKAGKVYCQLRDRHGLQFDAHLVKHIGHLIILCTVVAVELPSTLTRMHIAEAVRSNNQSAVEWLRKFGNQEVMLRACYERSGRATDIVGSLYESTHPIGIEAARELFYKVTGKPFNSVPIPKAARGTIQHAGLISDPEQLNANVEDEFDLDPDIAGEAVSGVARGLSASESKLTGTIDAKSCIAYMNWTVGFTNTSQYDREARAKILLPPGAAVNRATLTIDGVSQDAKFMPKSQARETYRRAVAERKDPLLVSMVGADRILVQCYPVKSTGTVKVQFDMVAPMQLNGTKEATLVLPTYEERNFQIDTPINVTLNSNRQFSVSGTALKATKDGRWFTVTGSIETPELARFTTGIRCSRDEEWNSFWTHSGLSGDIVSGNVSQRKYPRPSKLSVVLDGSIGMAPHMKQVIAALRALPTGLPVSIIYVRDGEMQICDATAGDGMFNAGLSTLENIPCAGGQNNKNALAQALGRAQGFTDSRSASSGALLWVHAAQPIATHDLDYYKDVVMQSSRPLLYDLEVAAGPDELLSGLKACPGYVRVERTASVEFDLKRLFAEWNGTNDRPYGGPVLKFAGHSDIQNVAMSRPVPGTDSMLLARSNGELRQLTAYQKIIELTGRPGIEGTEIEREAIQLAAKYHVVSPVSSAIVVDVPKEWSCTRAPETEKSRQGFDLFRGPREYIHSCMDQVTSQLNALSSTACAGGYYASHECKYTAASPAPLLSAQMVEGAMKPSRYEQRYDKRYHKRYDKIDYVGKAKANYQIADERSEVKQQKELAWQGGSGETSGNRQRYYLRMKNAKTFSPAGSGGREAPFDQGAVGEPMSMAEADSSAPQLQTEIADDATAAKDAPLGSPLAPEPEEWLLFGIGLGLIGAAIVVRRRTAVNKA